MKESLGLPPISAPGEAGVIPRRNDRAIRNSLGVYLAIGAAIALFMPEHLAESFGAARQFADWMSAVVPAVNRVANATPFPATSSLFMLIMVTGFPIAVIRLAKDWTFYPGTFSLPRVDQWFLAGAVMLVASIGVGMILFFPDVQRAELVSANGRGGWLLRLTTQYRLGLGLLGSLVFCVAAGTVGVACKLAYMVALRHKPE